MGPVGRAAAAKARELGAHVIAADSDPQALAVATRTLSIEAVPLPEGLRRARLIVEATPAADLIGLDDLKSDTVVAAPGMPLGVTAEAAQALGERLVHEPLALGVATMALKASL